MKKGVYRRRGGRLYIGNGSPLKVVEIEITTSKAAPEIQESVFTLECVMEFPHVGATKVGGGSTQEEKEDRED